MSNRHPARPGVELRRRQRRRRGRVIGPGAGWHVPGVPPPRPTNRGRVQAHAQRRHLPPSHLDPPPRRALRRHPPYAAELEAPRPGMEGGQLPLRPDAGQPPPRRRAAGLLPRQRLEASKDQVKVLEAGSSNPGSRMSGSISTAWAAGALDAGRGALRWSQLGAGQCAGRSRRSDALRRARRRQAPAPAAGAGGRAGGGRTSGRDARVPARWS